MDILNLIRKTTDKSENKGTQIFNNIVLDVTDTYTISGQKGSGKSFFATYLADSFPSVIFWDARIERLVKGGRNAESTKANILSDKWIGVKNSHELKEKIVQNKKHIVYHPEPLKRNKRTHEDFINEFDDISQLIYDMGDITFFVDEADNVCDLHHITEGFFNILEYGKHRNVGTVAITRRLQHLNPRIPRLSSDLFLFRLSGKDFKYISEFLPDEIIDSQEFNTLKYQMTALPDREFYHFNGKELKKYGEI